MINEDLENKNLDIADVISEIITKNDVVLFMKGSKKMPRCGFSKAVVDVLAITGVEEFKDIDVLSDENIRSGIKEYSNWPTIPQLYIKGEFVGGCDIVIDMHNKGELKNLLLKDKIIMP